MFSRHRIIVTVTVLFLCTGVLLADIDKLFIYKKKNDTYSTIMAGIINLKDIRYSGARFVNIVEKNIFTSETKPVLSSVKSSDGVEALKGFNYMVSGIIVSPESRIALITDIRTSQSQLLVEGEKLDEWTVAGITRKNITFKKSDGSQHVLQINVDDEK